MKIKALLIFAAGMLVGSALTYKGVKTKYEKIAREEIESVKESFQAHKKAEDEKREREAAAEQDRKAVKEIISETGYNKNLDVDALVGERPFVISPEDFGDADGFDAFSLTCFADRVVVDDNYDIVYDVDRAIGDALDHFGDWEDDAVHVRNPSRHCDYEVLKDLRTYQEFVKANPHKMG